MAKVIMVSRDFLRPHPRVGQSTYFVEKIFKGLYFMNPAHDLNKGMNLEIDYSLEEFSSCKPKWHTIRGGKRWKVGDKVSLRVWSGKPYRSEQIKICDDLEVKKVWDIKIVRHHAIDGRTILKILVGDNTYSEIILLNGKITEWFGQIDDLCTNDGLGMEDFYHWFDVPEFSGQIICWNEKIRY